MVGEITTCLWFDNEAEDAANFYTSIFENSNITMINRYGKEGYEFHHKKEGTAMTVAFQINGQNFTALNGGLEFKFNESMSFQVFCENQKEIDYYWNKLTSDGGEEGQCGWLKDKFGISWQIIPSVLPELLNDPAKAGKVTNAFLQMKKFEISKLLEV